jgi:diacylglycerol kinase (ATP)
MKAFIVLNPAAGQQDYAAVRRAFGHRFGAARIPYVIHETCAADRPGDLVRTRLREGFDLAVAAGGDGTVSAVIEGLVGSSVPLGIVPIGTGNLVARALGIPDEIDAAVALIAGSPGERRIDAMRIGERVFALNVSVGVSAAVIGGTTAMNKNRFGRVAYVWTTMLKIFTLRSRILAVAIDGVEHEYRAVEVAILNGAGLAGSSRHNGLKIRLEDGHLDVFIVGVNAWRDYVRCCFSFLVGRRADLPALHHRARRRILIRSRDCLPVQADGDVIGTTPIEVEFLPGAVTVLVPGDAGTATAHDPERDLESRR